MKILLVHPHQVDSAGPSAASWARKAIKAYNLFAKTPFGHGGRLPPLGLMMVAALTPPEHEVSIVDEYFSPVDVERRVDLVGISLLTPTACRGYELAGRFRAAGVPVVLGGIHASARPQEAKAHADAVVIGEAENVWERVVRDAEAKSLRPFYRAAAPCSMAGLPRARREALPPHPYLSVNLIQTTRGCPNRCSFCSIHLTAPGPPRSRPLADVMAEIDTFDTPLVLFTDDNIVADIGYAKKLFAAMKTERRRFCAQASLAMAADGDLLRLAEAAGCAFILSGFESLTQEAIRAAGKVRTNDVSKYAEAIKKFHDHGVGVAGTFIVGFEEDDASVFDRIADFIEAQGIDAPTVGILTPYPGSRLFHDLQRQGRLLHLDWRRYSHTAGHAVYRPARMTPDELEAGYLRVNRRLFSYPAIARRALRHRRYVLPLAVWNLGKRRHLGGDGFR